ncbi:MAG: hypothetical protein NC097_04805, partial [Clostridium sp.]|nr:hypothetical protein [Clostridium sp.]
TESETESEVKSEVETDENVEDKADILAVWRNLEEKTDALEQLRAFAEYQSDTALKVKDSLTRIDGFRNGSHEPDSRISMAVGQLLDIATNAANGIIDPEAIAMILRANDFDEAIERAHNEGEICGRNALIREKFFSPKSNVESVPALGGTSASADTRRPGSIFDLASFAR